jgi:hypothetical protein
MISRVASYKVRAQSPKENKDVDSIPRPISRPIPGARPPGYTNQTLNSRLYKPDPIKSNNSRFSPKKLQGGLKNSISITEQIASAKAKVYESGI